ncbi:MAG TPA: hypothetical protein VG755_15925 [Nannocystaceae bacterium]|nr:hypothetical protein [Nannocystaceae bacterium]
MTEPRATRRAFLVLLPAGFVLGACGSASDECEHAGDLDEQSDRVVFTSECGGGHTHDFTVLRAKLSDVPADGVHGSTTSYEGKHTHRVELSADDLEQIAAGMLVSKRTSLDAGHRHTFDFMLESGTHALT